jgi:hypothetical protein
MSRRDHLQPPHEPMRRDHLPEPHAPGPTTPAAAQILGRGRLGKRLGKRHATRPR